MQTDTVTNIKQLKELEKIVFTHIRIILSVKRILPGSCSQFLIFAERAPVSLITIICKN